MEISPVSNITTPREMFLIGKMKHMEVRFYRNSVAVGVVADIHLITDTSYKTLKVWINRQSLENCDIDDLRFALSRVFE